MHLRRDKRIYALTMTAAMTAAMCVVAPWAVSFGPVPVSFCTLLIYVAAWLLSPKRAVAAVAGYVLLGAAGLPVFSGFAGGFGWLIGPTGGYIAGYLLLAAVCAWFAARFESRRGMQMAGMVLGTAVLYGVGTAWFCLQTDTGLTRALVLCVLPFLPGDVAKILAALLLGPALRDRLGRSGLLGQ